MRESVVKKTILIVDDIGLMRTMLKKYIAMLGTAGSPGTNQENLFHVVEATNGVEALDVLDQLHVDFIFLDLMMPEMDGLTFLERKTFDSAGATIPVVVTTALCEDAAVDRALTLGATSFMAKPYTLEAVREVLTDLLPEGRRSQESTNPKSTTGPR